MTEQQLRRMALEALEREEYRLRQTGQSQVYSGVGFAITALRQAPEQQPKREWVGLTDEEIHAISKATHFQSKPVTAFARAIEAALRSKNT